MERSKPRLFFLRCWYIIICAYHDCHFLVSKIVHCFISGDFFIEENLDNFWLIKPNNYFHWEHWYATWLNIKYYQKFCKIILLGDSFMYPGNPHLFSQIKSPLKHNWFHLEYFQAIIRRDKVRPESRIWQQRSANVEECALLCPGNFRISTLAFCFPLSPFIT